MKRLTLLAVALVMVLGMAVSASAAPEVTISGNLLVNAVWNDNWDFNENDSDKRLNIYERADLYFTITANENLKGVLGLRSDRGEWGQGSFALGGQTGTAAGGAGLAIREAYIDFNWPGTDINAKVGQQYISLPTAIGGGSLILAERMSAALVSAPITDNVSVLAGYTRLADTASTDAQTDAWLIAAPLSFEGFSAAPYFVYANTPKQSTVLNEASSYWIGSDFTMSILDPFIIKADLIYGNSDNDVRAKDASGWLFDMGVDYTGFDFMTVSAFFVYTSGEDNDGTDGSERIKILANDWAVGSFFFGGGSITGDDMDNNRQNGFWTLGMSLTGIQSFAEGLTHAVHVLYVKGTNDKGSVASGALTVAKDYGLALTEKDSLWEVDFNTDYKIYDELTLYTQLGYINADYDTGVWGVGNDGGDAWKVATGVVYKF